MQGDFAPVITRAAAPEVNPVVQRTSLERFHLSNFPSHNRFGSRASLVDTCLSWTCWTFPLDIHRRICATSTTVIKYSSKIPAKMGSGSIKEARGETCSVEKVSLAPAHEQANATADRLKGNADHVSEMQKGVDEKVNSRRFHMQVSSRGFQRRSL